VIRPVDVLLEFLSAEQARGVTHVHLDQAARDGLRGLFNLTKTGSVAAPAAKTELPRVAMVLEEPTPAPVASTLSIAGSTRTERLDSLRLQAENWPPAKLLGSLRETMVFATGNPDARVMFIGEAPGYHEEKEREPFAGEAGQKLNEILKAMDLSRETVYLTNIMKFRPATPRQTTNNRKPSAEELAACLPFIQAEIDIVKPDCIIALGEAAAEALLGIADIGPFLRGSWHDFRGFPVRVTYHPSHLLKITGGNQSKSQVWEDMLAVMEKLGLPISDRQRGFFVPKP